VIVLPDPFFVAHRNKIAALARNNRLPAIYGFKEFVLAGGLISYGASTEEMYKRAATYVDKILKGTRPADLPIEQAREFELFINLKEANALGLTIPQSVLLRTDQVIE
jgi:putative tryptophan/tyrosine transport system substrate-binding protein